MNLRLPLVWGTGLFLLGLLLADRWPSLWFVAAAVLALVVQTLSLRHPRTSLCAAAFFWLMLGAGRMSLQRLWQDDARGPLSTLYQNISDNARLHAGRLVQRLQAQGIPYDQYCKMTGMDEAKFMEDGREPAVRQVKMDLAIAAIIKAENLDVTDEEIEEKYKSMAEQYGMELDMLKKYLDAPTVRNQLLNEKAIAVVVDSAKAEKPAKAEKTEGEEEKKPAKKTAKKAAEKAE